MKAPTRLSYLLLGLVLLIFSIALYAGQVWHGALNQDEGWYLYAARSVSEGALPYADFAFTQPPAMPLFYSLATPLIKWGGVAAGRGLTAVLGFLTALCVGWLAGRLTPSSKRPAAMLTAFSLVALNAYQTYFTTLVKTYSLCALFLVLSFISLSYLYRHGRILPALISGAFLALAAGTRISTAFAAPVLFLILLLREKDLKATISFVAGGVLVSLLLWMPLYLRAPDALLFWVVRYHTLREAGSPVLQWALKAGAVSRLVQVYFPAVGLGLLMLLLHTRVRPRRNLRCLPWLSQALWISVLLISLVQLGAAFPYDDYQVVVYPLLVAVLASELLRLLPVSRVSAWMTTAAISLLCLAHTGSSSLLQDWAVQGQDRIWWRFKVQSELAQLRAAGHQIKPLLGAENLLLTQDAYLAIECNARLPQGLEMGPFSIYPEWSDEEAQRRHVHNLNTLNTLIEKTPARVAALSGYAFSIASPQIDEIEEQEQNKLNQSVSNRFTAVDEFTHFGQGHTTLRIYQRSRLHPE